MEKNPTLLVVAAALINGRGRVLVQRRPEGKAMAGLWEFPGGKVEPGEAPEAALRRELHEELGITVAAEALRPATFASAGLGDRAMLLMLYLCWRWEGEAQALDAAELKWAAPDELAGLPMPPADVPLVALLGDLIAALAPREPSRAAK